MNQFSRRQVLAAGALLPLAAPMIARANPRELRLGMITPVGHSWNEAAIAFGEMLSAETDGRLTMSLFPAGQLGNEGAMVQQLQSGALDMAIIQAAELGSRADHIAAINAPYLVNSTDEVARLLRHPEVVDLFDVLPEETGTIGLGWLITGMRSVFSVGDLDSVAGMSGMKLRINPTPVYRDFYQLLGVAPTPIATPQVYDAMANGQVDGLEADIEFSWNQRFDQVSKSILQLNAVFMPAGFLVSGRVWQAMAESDREVITNCVDAALDDQFASLVAEEPSLIQNLKDTGIPMHEVSQEDRESLIKQFDDIWLPRAPVIERLREIGASI